METKQWFFTIVVFLCSILDIRCENRARGFNDLISWVGYEDGINQAKASGKPVLLLVHKTWCGACKSLKPKVATSKEMEDLSSNFVMINIQDDEENDLPNKGRDYQPDGGYIPRLMFLEPDGTLRTDIINEGGNDKYKHYYSDEHQIVKSMKKAMDLMPASSKDREL